MRPSSESTPIGVWQDASSSRTTKRSASRAAWVEAWSTVGNVMPSRPWTAITPWPAAGTKTPSTSLDPTVTAQPFEPGRRQHQRVDLARLALGQPRVHVPADLDDLQVRPPGQQLRAAAQRARAHPRALAQVADDDVERVRAARRGHDRRPRRELRRHVLGRVHGHVDLVRQQRGLQGADPARLVAARAVHVTGGGDLHQLDLAVDQRGDRPSLGQRQRAAPRP